MASTLPAHRKQHVFVTKDDRKATQHPLSPHTAEDEQQVDDVDSDDNVLLYSHPLSPHATSRQDDQAQCINENNVHTVSTSNVTVTAHPLSPHTTSVEDERRSSRSYSTSSATNSTLTTNPMLTPLSSVTAQEASTTNTAAANAANSRSTAAITTPGAASSIPSNNINKNAQPKTILLINGPNLNLLGHREPHIYGSTTLQDITQNLTKLANSNGINLQHFQSNHEADIINRIHACLLGKVPHPITSSEWTQSQPTQNHQTTTTATNSSNDNDNEINFPKPDAILINPGAYTHTSIALRDALLGISTPFIEIHISNVHARDQFRHKSFLSDKAEAVICGLGVYGYEAGLNYWVRKWNLEGRGKE